jgi:hypothetical protein
LKKGDTVELPEDDIAVRALSVRKQIVEAAEQQEPIKKKTTKKQK